MSENPYKAPKSQSNERDLLQKWLRIRRLSAWSFPVLLLCSFTGAKLAKIYLENLKTKIENLAPEQASQVSLTPMYIVIGIAFLLFLAFITSMFTFLIALIKIRKIHEKQKT